MNTLRRVGLLSIPLTFLLAGTGMIWLLTVENATGPFFDKLVSNRSDWLGAHVILLLSTVFLLPAALTIRSTIQNKTAGAFATLLLILIACTNILLTGQYAIDFVMPLLSDVGGDALQVHGLLYETALVDTLFYKLPNLVFLGLFLLTCTLFSNKEIPIKFVFLLLINWILVLTGNLIHPLFQRIAILLLSLSFLPFVLFYWKKEKADLYM